MNVPAMTINKVCLSGLDAIALADQLIRAGEFEIVVAGGMESMSQAPHLLEKSREGFKYGDVTMRDHMAYDGLWDAFTDQAMGVLTERGQHRRRSRSPGRSRTPSPPARTSWPPGPGRTALFDDEVVSVEIPQRKGDPVVFRDDEGIRADTTVESLGRLRPAFSKDGTITAGSASQISDGAAAVVVMSKPKAESLGLTWLAEIGAHGVVAGPDSTLQAQPANAIRAGVREGGHRPERPRPGRDQRGVRGRRAGLDQGARHRPGPGQRQRRGDRPRPPDRHVRRARRAPPGAGAEASRRRGRGRRPVRWRRAGRGAAAALAVGLSPAAPAQPADRSPAPVVRAADPSDSSSRLGPAAVGPWPG